MNTYTEIQEAKYRAYALVTDRNFTFRSSKEENGERITCQGNIPELQDPKDQNRAALFLKALYKNPKFMEITDISCDIIRQYLGKEELSPLEKKMAYTAGFALENILEQLPGNLNAKDLELETFAEYIIRIYEYQKLTLFPKKPLNSQFQVGLEKLTNLINEVINICECNIPKKV